MRQGSKWLYGCSRLVAGEKVANQVAPSFSSHIRAFDGDLFVFPCYIDPNQPATAAGVLEVFSRGLRPTPMAKSNLSRGVGMIMNLGILDYWEGLLRKGPMKT